MVGRTRYTLPLSPSLARKFDALSAELDVRVLAARANGSLGEDARFRLYSPVRPRRLDGLVFYVLLPLRVARELRRHVPDVVLVQGAQEAALTLLGRAVARVATKVVVDVHGDPGAATRLYGSPARGVLSGLGDAMARVALRRADGVRTISGYTSALVRQQGVEPAATFPAFMDLDPFLADPPAPLPSRPCAVFVGVLERYKGVDVLAEAWRRAAPRLPGALLHLVGSGTLTEVPERLLADLPEQTRWSPALSTPDVAGALDDASVLVLPSRSEGLGRVVIEAFCRRRGVIGSRIGGIPDLVEGGVNGLLVAAGDAEALADAMVEVLSDRPLAERLGSAGHASVKAWTATPEEYASRVSELVETVAGRR
jgi:glycosyltransferase involved in cell wall biosynthesis